MLSQLARSGAAAPAAVLLAPVAAGERIDRTVGVAHAGIVLTGVAAIGAIALTTGGPDAGRGFGGLSDVKTVRDAQLPTL